MLSVRNVIAGAVLVVLLPLAGLGQEQVQKASPDAPEPSSISPQTDAEKPAVNPLRKSSSPIEDPKYELQPGTDPENRLGPPFVKHLAADQYAFWTAPAHFKFKDLEWIAPFAGVTAGFMAGDSWVSKQIPLGEVSRSKTFSNYATYSLIGAGAGSFLLGHLTSNDQLSEAGLLSGEAALNSTAVTYLFKDITRRERPYQGSGNGNFFQGGSSFPS